MSSQEEFKLSDPQPGRHSNPQVVQWLWQSDRDPWAEKDSTKWTWMPYSYEQCDLIESAFSHNQNMTDLGDYEIDLKKMVQVNKKDRNRIRRVKREVNIVLNNRFMIELPDPIPVEKIEQTINPAFGTVQHFLDFIMKRTHETYTLFKRLKDLDLNCKQDQYQDVIQAVIKCIQKAAESNEKVAKSRGFSYWKSPIQEAKDIVAEIELKSSNSDFTLREFLKLVLRAYTMESFICYWLNELLRSENWKEINLFTPYLVCLAYTFQIKDYIIPYQAPQGLMGRFNSLFWTQKLMLYRGTALVKEHVKFYHPDTTRLFSWNGVTSTSRSKDEALKFIHLSLKKVKPGEKIGVLFTIETDLASALDAEGMIDISKDSKFPSEQEVILAPGSVFEVIGFQLDEHSYIYEVRLALRKKFKKNHKILGDLQGKIMNGRIAELDGLKYEELVKAINLLEGNQLVGGIMIKNCVLDDHLVELIGNMRRTTNMKEKNILVINNEITVDTLMILCYSFSCRNLGQVLDQNKFALKADADASKNIINNYKMNEISLDTKAILQLFHHKLFDRFCDEFQDNKQVTTLKLSLTELLPSPGYVIALLSRLTKFDNLRQISLNLATNRWDDIKRVVKELNPLINLRVDFLKSPQVSDKDMETLKDDLMSLTSLTHLHLDFTQCPISDKGIDSFKDVFKSLTALTHLHLDFGDCEGISDEGIDKLKDSLKPLISLNQLNLDFGSCGRISAKGKEEIKVALMLFTSFSFLDLDFPGSIRVTNKGVDKFKYALLPLVPLARLHLDFNKGDISDEGIAKIKDVLSSISSLTHLHLNFAHCEQISDQGIGNLKAVLKPLTSLTYLNLDFGYCRKISDEGISNLKDVLNPLTSLTHLQLVFTFCTQISTQGMEKLKDALKPLTSLKHLHLDFGSCARVSDEGMDKLKDALKPLASLTHLHLDFTGYVRITSMGIDRLKDSLLSLISLNHIELNFKYCKQISDLEIVKLKEGLKSLTLLTHLHLCFTGCPKITDKGIDQLKDALKSLTSLIELHLAFQYCGQISDEGIDKLKDAFKLLTALTQLHLDFGCCPRVSDKGINKLKDGLKSLTSLTHLHLDFHLGSASEDQISDAGIEKLKDVLESLTSLTDLHLDFSQHLRISSQTKQRPVFDLKHIRNLSVQYGVND